MAAATLTRDEIAEIEHRFAHLVRRPLLARAVPWLVGLSIVGYLAFCIWFFSLAELLAGGKWERIGLLLREWVTYTSRPDIRLTPGRIDIAFNRFDPLGHDPKPDWIVREGADRIVILFGTQADRVEVTPQRVLVSRAGEQARLLPDPQGWHVEGTAPAWLRVQEGGARVSFGFAGEVEIDEGRIGVWRHFLGWANFLFDTDSRLSGVPLAEVGRLIVGGDRLDPARSNLALAFDDFWNNSAWQHGDVLTKLLQTIVMAFVGTLFAALLALPLAFLSARTILPFGLVNGLGKRFFEALRTIDIFVWALFFTRGFGPGPLAGIAAIFVTDTGTLGKTYTEALENIDERQREGMRSVGASALQVQRYGVLPQVMPVLASQALYQWESNTRSATIIGAMGAGGIGLKLLEAMRTNSNWANVCYMVVLILLVVFVFDNVSQWLRRRLIAGAG